MCVEWTGSCDGCFAVFAFEGLDLFDVGDVVLHLCEGRQCLSRNSVAKVLLNLHRNLNGIERVQSVLSESAALRDACVEEAVPCL